jgi:hypothetical protein
VRAGILAETPNDPVQLQLHGIIGTLVFHLGERAFDGGAGELVLADLDPNSVSREFIGDFQAELVRALELWPSLIPVDDGYACGQKGAAFPTLAEAWRVAEDASGCEEPAP